MTPESAGIQLIAEVIARLGTTPILLFLSLILVGPWMVIAFWAWMMERRQSTRFEAVVQMYQNNVELVKSYEGITKNLQDLVILTASTMQTLVRQIDSNLYCPVVRKKTKQTEVDSP